MKESWLTLLPSWIQAFGVLGLIFVVIDRVELDNKGQAKTSILRQLSSAGQPLFAESLFKGREGDDEHYTVALYELLADRVILKTAMGYEVARHNTRLFDDIEAVVEYLLKDFNLSSKKPKVELPEFISRVKSSLVSLESKRGNNNAKEYVNKIEYYIGLVIIKKVGSVYSANNLLLKSVDGDEVKLENVFLAPQKVLIEKIKTT